MPSSAGAPELSLIEKCLTQGLLIRHVENKLLALYKEGLLHGTIHTCVGQELSGVAVATRLRQGDNVFSNHRGHGHYLAFTQDIVGLIAEVMGKSLGVCAGRGGSQHLCKNGFFSNGILGGTAPCAAGLALAHKLRKNHNIAVLFIGDGALGEGVVYETFNLAAILNLPLYIVCEANGIAQTTFLETVMAGDLQARAQAFGIKTLRSDTWNLEELLTDVAEAEQYVRTQSRPLFHVIHTYRLNAHSKGDDTRSPEEIEKYRRQDLLVKIENEANYIAIVNAIRQRVDAAVTQVLASENAVSTMHFHPIVNSAETEVILKQQPDKMVERIQQGLALGLYKNNRALLFGEDVEAPYGGAFKVTGQLSAKFPGRVFNMPISEQAMTGMGNGLAMCGFTPIVEIMFGDFLTLVMDQLLNHAAKFSYMYNEQIKNPLIIRTPMGGRRGYGPTHSQCLEKHFLGIPFLTVVAVNYHMDVTRFYEDLIVYADTPHLIIEDKISYALAGNKRIPAFDYVTTEEKYPTVILKPVLVPQATLICYGGSLVQAEQLIESLLLNYEFAVECICPSRLYPLNIHAILSSVRQTKRLIIFEEGQLFAAFGAEVIAQIVEKTSMALEVIRIGPQASPVPAAYGAELQHLPTAQMAETIIVERFIRGTI
ncbi:MAG: hypothetical protein A3E83_01690 [Gammaproteobacteria bacterium RIFCSPHIGHO2_12_FULL_41_20]|nr:MAG: hypothetical protein A3E83_01690 [Gammaproteobacteria bacterium RIFCSPHIGHO2_12_FULL_41_20]